MAFTKSRKVHLKRFKLFGNKIQYKKIGSICGGADIGAEKFKDFKVYVEKFPSDVCKNCLKKYNETLENYKKGE